MPECHSCPHSTDPKLRDKPWAETPCATCRLSDEPSHKGETSVSRDSSDAVMAEEILQVAEPEREQVNILADFIRQFMTLPSTTRDIAAFRFIYPDRPLSEIAKRYSITVQAAHSRLKRALEKCPVLDTVISMRTYNRKTNDTATDD